MLRCVVVDPNGCTRALQYALRHPLVVPDTGVPSPRPVNTGDYLKRKVHIYIYMYIRYKWL